MPYSLEQVVQGLKILHCTQVEKRQASKKLGILSAGRMITKTVRIK